MDCPTEINHVIFVLLYLILLYIIELGKTQIDIYVFCELIVWKITTAMFAHVIYYYHVTVSRLLGKAHA